MVGEVRLTRCEQTRNGCLQVVINPDTTHGVVHRRIDLHWRFVRVVVGNLLIHLEEVTVFVAHHFFTKRSHLVVRRVFDAAYFRLCFSVTHDSAAEIEENSFTCFVYTIPFIAAFFRCARCYIARNEVTKRWVSALEVVVTIFFRNLNRFLAAVADGFNIFKFSRNPDAAIVAKRLRHQR